MIRSLTAIAVIAVLSARGGSEEKPYQPRPKGTLTFNKDIAPVVFKQCATCHRPGEVAPFSLLSYKDVKKRAKQIGEVTTSRFMPPWKPVAGHGEFRGERRLTVDQIGILKQWADEGSAEGDAKDLPPAPQFAEGWQLGKPDLIVTMPKAFDVPAEGRDLYRNFVIPLEVPEGKYIRAVEFRPTNRRVVHHAGLSIDVTNKSRERDGKDGAPGFTQVGLPGQQFPANLTFWVPGQEVRPLPDGMAFPWPKGADFILQLHLHPSGKRETEQSTVGFYFTSDPPRQHLDKFMLAQNKINILAGEKAYRSTDKRTLTVDTELYGIFPHMHLIGKDVKVTAVLPDGKSQSLLWIDQWDFNWQNYYEYAKPVLLPKGTQLVMETTHDNSAENPANPNQPPKRVTFGEQTQNEMAIIFMTTLPKGPTAAKGEVKDFKALAQEVLNRFDKNKDGKLSADELREIPAAAGLDIPALIRRFDRDGDGMLDAAELAELIKAMRK